MYWYLDLGHDLRRGDDATIIPSHAAERCDVMTVMGNSRYDTIAMRCDALLYKPWRGVGPYPKEIETGLGCFGG